MAGTSAAGALTVQHSDLNLSLAEICSSHPTSGGPYYWAAMLSPPKYAPIASWLCGWFNLLGQFSGTTGIK